MGTNEESWPYTHTHSSRMREKILARLPELRSKLLTDYLLMHKEARLLLNIKREDQRRQRDRLSQICEKSTAEHFSDPTVIQRGIPRKV